ncbi:MAG: recombinase family protein [Oscillospiraceae bacterium]|nr:recombinase family protein [Oscillospiraceae bacterium]
MNRIAVYTYDSKGSEVFINKHLKKMEEFIENSFGDDVKYDVFVDKTGLSGDRAGFNQLMDKIKQKQYTFLIVPNINRIYRPEYNMGLLMQFMKEIESNGVQILDLSQGSTPQEIIYNTIIRPLLENNASSLK